MKYRALHKKSQFLFLGNTTFGEGFQREHAFAMELGRRGFSVRYVNGIPSFFSRLQRARSTYQKHTADEVSNVEVLTPPMVPTTFRSSWTPTIDQLLFRRWFSKTFAGWDWPSTTVCVMFPYWWSGFVRKTDIGSARIVYDICDALLVPSRTPQALNRMQLAEDLLKDECNVVTCSAHTLQHEWNSRWPEKHAACITNGVWSTSASRKNSSAAARPMDSIIFIGTIDERWVDVELMMHLAGSLPACNVTLVGEVREQYQRMFSKFSNISCVGPVPHQRVAELMRHASVGIIPFKKNAITDRVNPIKLYEYAAAGVPIVATRSEELNRLAHIATLAQTPDEFVKLVGKKLKAPERERKQLVSWARRNTWERKTDEWLKAIGVAEFRK